MAAVYNVCWGTLTVFFPNLILIQAEMEPLNHPFIMSVIGMLVGVYGYGFWVVSKNLYRYPQIITIATLGKTFGTIGALYFIFRGSL